MAATKPLGIGIFLFGAGILAPPTAAIAIWNRTALSSAGLHLRELTYASTPGEVLSSEVESQVAWDGDTTFRVKLTYRYAVNGRTYTGTRAESRPLSSTGPWVSRYVAAHPPGTPVTVWFDASDPATAVLEPGFTRAELFFLLLLLPADTYLGLGWYYVWRWCFREQAAPGFQATGSGARLGIRLPRGTTWAIPLAIAVLGLPASYLLFLAVAGSRATVWPGALVLLGVLALAVTLYRRRVSDLRAGRFDLVIDREARRLILPCTFGRRRPVAVAFPLVRSVTVETRTIVTEDSSSFVYRPSVSWRDEDGAERVAALAEWDDRALAERLASWVKGQVVGG